MGSDVSSFIALLPGPAQFFFYAVFFVATSALAWQAYIKGKQQQQDKKINPSEMMLAAATLPDMHAIREIAHALDRLTTETARGAIALESICEIMSDTSQQAANEREVEREVQRRIRNEAAEEAHARRPPARR